MISVLVVDDVEAVRYAICGLLRMHGYDPVEATDGEHAIRILDAMEPSVVILDLMMPGVDGRGVLRHLRTTGRTTKVIISSGYIDDTIRAELAPLMPDAYVDKPWKSDFLFATINRLAGNPSSAPAQDKL